MLNKISHIMVYVNDMNKSIEFYHEKLGLPIRTRSEHWSEVGGEENGVFIGLHPTSTKSRDLTNTTDIVFHVKDITSVRKSLEKRGVEFYDDIKEVGPNIWFTSFYDPDGNNLSIHQNQP